MVVRAEGGNQTKPEKEGWTPPETDTGANEMGTTSGEISTGRGVWFLRPKPIQAYVPSALNPAQQQEYYQVRNYGYYDPSDLAGAYDSLDPNTQLLFQTVAEATGGRSGSALFNRYAKESERRSRSGIRQSPMDILYDVAYKRGILKDDGTFEVPEKLSETASTGAYKGPRQTIAREGRRDVRLTADAIASEVLGRAVTDEEFERVLSKVRQAEQQEPTVSMRSEGMTVSESGLSAAGRKDVIREALSKGPEAQEFTQATKMMDLFNTWLERRPG